MPYSLRTKLKHLVCERDITVKECERLIKALDTVDAVEEIKAEIKLLPNANPSYWNRCDVVDREEVLELIDKHIRGKETDDYFRGAQQEI